jgi:hypothetical protein
MAATVEPRLRIHVRFSGVEQAFTKRGQEPYATYEVSSAEGEARLSTRVRWSDLCRLHDELPSWQRLLMPQFKRHALRSKVGRTSTHFCEGRAAAMEKVLQGLVTATGTSLLRGTGPAPLQSFLSSGSEVTHPTPEECWYCVERGWPASVAEHGPPHCAPRELSPSASDAPALLPTPSEILGEVRVEVLEATGLLRADSFSQNDVYALFVLGGVAVASAILEDTAHPRCTCTCTCTCTWHLALGTWHLAHGTWHMAHAHAHGYKHTHTHTDTKWI